MKNKCFAMTVGGCTALEDGCSCVACLFYKDRKQFDDSREKGWARMRELPLEQQIVYANKYYEGRMPWYGTKEAFA